MAQIPLLLSNRWRLYTRSVPEQSAVGRTVQKHPALKGFYSETEVLMMLSCITCVLHISACMLAPWHSCPPKAGLEMTEFLNRGLSQAKRKIQPQSLSTARSPHLTWGCYRSAASAPPPRRSCGSRGRGGSRQTSAHGPQPWGSFPPESCTDPWSTTRTKNTQNWQQ